MVFGQRWVLFDGDVDRIVYYFMGVIDNRFYFLDGDKIVILVVGYFKDLVQEIGFLFNLGFV